jgi:membrane associated rhomboid family serine protease
MQGLACVYLAQVFLAQFALKTYVAAYQTLGLRYDQVFGEGQVWQLLTYSLLHDVNLRGPNPAPLFDLFVCGLVVWGIYRASRLKRSRSEPMLFIILAFAAIFLTGQLGFGAPFHLGGNLLFLYFFGPLFERHWGPKRFLIFCSLSAAGGALLATLLSIPLSERWVGTGAVGASGTMMGLLMAYTVYYKNETVLAGFVLPMRAQHLLILVVVFDVLSLLSPGSSVAFFVHMGGLLTGWLLTTGNWRPSRWRKLIPHTKKLPLTKNRSHLRIVRREDNDDEPPLIH